MRPGNKVDFFAIAWNSMSSTTREGPNELEGLPALKRTALERGVRLINHLILDDEGWTAVRPHHGRLPPGRIGHRSRRQR
jgi:hypothetical protein